MSAKTDWTDILGFKLEKDQDGDMLLIETDSEPRHATLTERVLWSSLLEQEAKAAQMREALQAMLEAFGKNGLGGEYDPGEVPAIDQALAAVAIGEQANG